MSLAAKVVKAAVPRIPRPRKAVLTLVSAVASPVFILLPTQKAGKVFLEGFGRYFNNVPAESTY